MAAEVAIRALVGVSVSDTPRVGRNKVFFPWTRSSRFEFDVLRLLLPLLLPKDRLELHAA